MAIAGDGCFTMVPHVLCTAVEYNIPVVWVIWNNFGWVVDPRHPATACSAAASSAPRSTRAPTRRRTIPDFAAWARASGVEALTVTKSQDFKGALEHAVKANKPFLLDVHVDADVRPPATGTWQLAADAATRSRCSASAGCRMPECTAAVPRKLRCRTSHREANDADGARATTDAFIRNIAEVPWRQFPDHFGGALSKPLVMPETAGSQHIDYRISMYQPMAYVELHKHKVQEQVYHVLEARA